MSGALLPERPQPTLGGMDSQLSEVWSQATEPLVEAGEADAAKSLGRAEEGESVTGGDDDDAASTVDSDDEDDIDWIAVGKQVGVFFGPS